MNISAMAMESYCEALSTVTPSPDLGSALALNILQGMSLLTRVCYLTLGNERYAIHEPLILDCLPQLGGFRESISKYLESGLASQGEAFSSGGEEWRQSLPQKSQVFLRLMAYSLEGLKLCDRLLGFANPEGTGDLGVAVHFFQGGLEGAWLNLLVTLPEIDEELYRKYARETGEKLLLEGQSLAVFLSKDTLSEVMGG